MLVFQYFSFPRDLRFFSFQYFSFSVLRQGTTSASFWSIVYIMFPQSRVAMWALSLLCVVFLLLIWNHKSGGRPTCTADSLFHSTWCCMAPNQRRCNRKSDFSDTFELGRDAYREIVEQYISRTQPNFHHLAIRYVDNCFVIVQKHHPQAPVFKVFTDLDFYGSPV